MDILQNEAWEDWCEGFSREFAKGRGWIQSEDQQGRMYRGLSHAVTEIVLGSALFLSHKKTVSVLHGESWAFESVLPQLYKMGLHVREVSRAQIDDPEAWISQLSPDTNCVMWAEDHPVTGAYEDRSGWAALLSKKRIHSVIVSHAAHWLRPQVVEPYGVRLMSLNLDYCWGSLGSRFRTPPLMAHRMNWTAPERGELIQRLKALSFLENRDLVEKIEMRMASSPAGFQRFPFTGDRLWDRALFFHSGYNADALLEADDVEGRVQSLSRCSREIIPPFHRWWEPLPSADVLSGLLIADLASLQSPGFEERFKNALTNASFEAT